MSELIAVPALAEPGEFVHQTRGRERQPNPWDDVVKNLPLGGDPVCYYFPSVEAQAANIKAIHRAASYLDIGAVVQKSEKQVKGKGYPVVVGTRERVQRKPWVLIDPATSTVITTIKDRAFVAAHRDGEPFEYEGGTVILAKAE